MKLYMDSRFNFKGNIILLIFLFISTLSFSQEWRLDNYTDEFGDLDPSGKNYINGIINGTFSNSAVTNAKLTIIVFLEKLDGDVHVSFKFLEYGNQVVKAYENTYYSLKVKTPNNNVVPITGVISKGGDVLREKGWWKKINPALNLGRILISYPDGNVKVLMKEVSNGFPSTYSFTFSNKGLKTLVTKLK